MANLPVSLLPPPHTGYGIAIYELGDEGGLLIAFGHQDVRRFFAACQSYMRKTYDWPNLADDKAELWAEFWPTFQDDVSYRHADFIPGAVRPDEEWALAMAEDRTPDTQPVTTYYVWDEWSS